MSAIISIISSAISLIKVVFDFLPKYDKRDRREEAQRLFYLVEKIKMSLTDLILYFLANHKRIYEFLNVIERTENIEMENVVNVILSVFPLPTVVKLSDEDVFSLSLNLMTKDIRDNIEETNAIAENLKDEPRNITLLSRLWAHLGVLATGSLFDDYEKVARFQIEHVNKILEKEICVDEINRNINRAVENLRKMSEAYESVSEEFDKTSSEIEGRFKGILK